ncbi:hypothetical protein [Sphingomicrobium marinum]|uniref:hypothetical protein n=1 Tax=Sphingomicrobium marinum TaxID=1227950 RepID=UPI00223F7541|nr:hypothetical protein [Sphingomicrobium marinum]
MSSPTSFLAMFVAGWVILRVATAGFYPGAFAKPLDTIPLVAAASVQAAKAPRPATTVYVPYPVYIEHSADAVASPPTVAAFARPAGMARAMVSPPPRARAVDPMPWTLSAGGRPISIVATALPPPRPAPVSPGAPAVAPPPFDRWQLSGWGLFRDDAPGQSLAAAGALGGSQAGARLLYRVDQNFAVSARASAPANRDIDGGEVALGVRFTPFTGIPLSLTAERRQGIGDSGGRNDFALFAEAGVWDRSIAADVKANAYIQGGAVGIEERNLFVDGALTLTRPLIANVDGGLGIWGGAQPGLSRLDVGPRLSMPLYGGVKLHLDWRQQVAGNADPGSGPVVSLGADF